MIVDAEASLERLRDKLDAAEDELAEEQPSGADMPSLSATDVMLTVQAATGVGTLAFMIFTAARVGRVGPASSTAPTISRRN